MSELIHKEDRGVMIANNVHDILKCGFKVRKNQIHHKYTECILEIPISRIHSNINNLNKFFQLWPNLYFNHTFHMSN